MNKKRWVLLLLIGGLVFGYIKLFYKKLDLTAVPKSADSIIALDVKRITNTILWNIITTPSQWKISSNKSKKSDEVEWKDIIDIPDFVLLFHIKEQPITTWYTLLKIKNEENFTKGLLQQHFVQQDSSLFLNLALGILLYKKEGKILVTNWATATKRDVAKVVDELFVQKEFIAKETLTKILNANSHVAMHFNANKFFGKDGIVSANFDKGRIEIKGTLTPNNQLDFKENNFTYSANSLLTIGFTQPTASVYGLINDTLKTNISKAMNLNIDSLLLQSNRYYQLDITSILPRIDSAIAYTYDDDFNKVEKVVVNNVEEPAFHFSIVGDSISTIFNNWQLDKKIEQTNNGNLFLPIPFVKSYCAKINDSLLTISSNNYIQRTANKNTKCLLFVHLLVAKAPTSLLKYLPDYLQKAIVNLESLDFVAHKEKASIEVKCVIRRKE